MRTGQLVLALACTCLPWVPAGSAAASTPIKSFSVVPSNTQAGGHPDIEVQFSVENRVLQHSESACNCEDAKDADLHLPPGFIGNPHATPQCTVAQFSADECPVDSQVGIANVLTTNGIPFDTAVYNIVPPPEDAGLLGFKIFLFDTPQFTVLSSRTGGDYGLDADTTSIFHGIFPLEEIQEVLWGVPADPIHDRLRINPRNSQGGPSFIGSLCDESGSLATSDPESVYEFCIGNFVGFTPLHSNALSTPFLQNPTTCESALSSTLEVLSYDGGLTSAQYPWPKQTGCDQLSFNPSLYAQPTTSQSDSPAGIDANLTVPQPLAAEIPSPSELRDVVVSFPPGFSINPNAADGKTSCSDAEARFGTEEEGHCPENAKIGSLTIESSALPGPLPGFVYLGEPLPGNRYRMFLLANGFGVHIKLLGIGSPDPQTGQLVVALHHLPQSPLTNFNLHIFGSERGVLATPTRCGTYPVVSTFTPWDESLAVQTSTQYFDVDTGPEGRPCPGANRPFSPSFDAASRSRAPGVHAPFSLEVVRPDGDQNLTGLSVKTPPGFAATLKGVSYCPEPAIEQLSNPLTSGLAELSSPACPPSSQIGTAVGGAGAGSHPVYVPGKVYLAGPYAGAPLSLVVDIPAVSGPYDLGDIAVRVAIHVDPNTAQVTAVSDPLPQIIGGIPLRTRSIRVNLDRPDFTVNPTNCDGFSVDADILGSEGATATPAAHFQLGNCGTLPFRPNLGLRFKGGTRRARDPSLRAVLSGRPGDANIARAVVLLPHSEFIDQAHIQGPCTRVQFAAHECPAGSLIGHAVAESPLLEKPLAGPVLIRSSVHRLPDMVIALRGQVSIDLVARVDSIRERLRATFDALPDVPVSRIRLTLAGGARGLLENSEELCLDAHHALVRLVAQNGRARTMSIPANGECRPSGRR